MKITKALTETGMARTGGEAQRLVKQGAVWVGGCIPPCNMRMPPYKCSCGGWRKITNPVENVKSGEVMRVGDGNYRLLTREGKPGFDNVPGIAWVPRHTFEESCAIEKEKAVQGGYFFAVIDIQ